MKIELTPVLALRLIAADGCHTFTTGIGSCLKAGSGRAVGAHYEADRVCDACLADAALHEDGDA